MPRPWRSFSCWPAFLALVTVAAQPLGAQQSAVVEQLAPLLAAEDARDFQPELYRRALVSTDSVVRRVAAIGAGRIGDPAAVPLLVPIMLDPDSTVRVAAVFGLGLLGDSSAVQPLIERLTGTPAAGEDPEPTPPQASANSTQ